MDPVGPWSYSYNRLAAGVPAGATSGDFHHHLATAAANSSSLSGHNSAVGVPSTTSQLLLQAAHTTSLGGTTASPFNPGGFLSPAGVSYEAVFSPLFHHTNPKPAHYSSTINQHRQALAQAQAVVTKQVVDSELIRENYTPHHQSLSAAQTGTFFEQSPSGSAPSAALAWQGNNQLPSPFGILPHENVVPSSPGPPTSSKTTPTVAYENFNAHFAAAQSLNQLNSQLNANKNIRSSSPQVNSSSVNKTTTNSSFYPSTVPTTYGGQTESLTNYSGSSSKQQVLSQDSYGNSGKNNRGGPSIGASVTSSVNVTANNLPHNSHESVTPTKPFEKKFNIPTNVGTGFMASYLKFLQGERDTSPPPISRGGRKGNWTRAQPATVCTGAPTSNTNTTTISTPSAASTIKLAATQNENAQQQKPQVDQISNGMNVNQTHNIAQQHHSQQPTQSQAQQMHQQHQQYYPVQQPKERKRKYDGSVDVDESNIERNRSNKPVLNIPSTTGGNKKCSSGAGSGGTIPTTQPGGGGNIVNLHDNKVIQTPVMAALPKKSRQTTPQIIQPPQVQPQMMQQTYYQPPEEVLDPLSIPPRRETSHRKAKGRSIADIIQRQTAPLNMGGGNEGDELEEPQEFIDSDSDPAWTPSADKDDEEELNSNRKKITKKGAKKNFNNSTSGRQKKSRSNILSVAVEGAGINDFYSSEEEQGLNNNSGHRVIQHQPVIQHTTINHQQQQQQQQPSQQYTVQYDTRTNLAEQTNLTNLNNMTILHQQQQQPSTNSTIDDNTEEFKQLDFVVIRSDLNQDWPTLWRVDGKSLLQKFEPFIQNGKTFYRNISTYAAWTADSRKLYVKVPVRYRSSSLTDCVVEFMKNEISFDNNSEQFIEKVMFNMRNFQDNFQVYLQTLISQALDSTFLAEIFEEKDRYFLTNVRVIEDITEDHKKRLFAVTPWPKTILSSLSTWPCYNLITELDITNMNHIVCNACHQSNIASRVLFYGQAYNTLTLEPIQLEAHIASEKDILLCRICSTKIDLLHKIAHQKYLMFIECAKRVSQKNHENQAKVSTDILNELLADEMWLTQLFRDIRRTWAEVEWVEHQIKYQL